MPRKELAVKNSTILFAYLLIIWGFYRIYFKLPEELEDLIVKPILWLVPVFFLIRKEGLGLSSIGFNTKNLFSSVYFSLVLGIVFAIVGLLTNFVKYKGLNFSANIGEGSFFAALLLSFATAVSEEITFRGYIFSRVWHALGSEWVANFVVSLAWALIHVPTYLFWLKLKIVEVLLLLFLTTIFSLTSGFVYARTKNVFSSILLRVFWGWPIVLFR